MFSLVLRKIFFTEIWNASVNWNEILRIGQHLGLYFWSYRKQNECKTYSMNQSCNSNMNNETNFKDITRGRTKQFPTDGNEVAQFEATLDKESD